MDNHRITIEPGRGEKNYWKDLWVFRELFYILSWRDLKVRYKQTVIGAAWSVVRPLLTTLIFAFIFNRVAKLQAPPHIPYKILVFTGMLPWQFFANALSEASSSLTGNANLISKVYFPRLIIPASSIITSLVDFGISFILLIGMMVFYQFVPDIKILLLPLFIILSLLAALGTGLYVTALNVKYRDFRYIIPFVIQIGLYITPVGFSSSMIAEKWRILYSLNPMVGIVDGFRWCILNEPLYWPGFLASVGIIIFFLFLGVWYFRKTEKSFADNI
ncbi:MAG TPA: ABC transporter permease [Cyclobacteriaceae bacterium]|jgi:lipopolysaccharide transport system permease protein|nr:ABC transporter permease [Cyclobacteriaceae bacterium]